MDTRTKREVLRLMAQAEWYIRNGGTGMAFLERIARYVEEAN